MVARFARATRWDLPVKKERGTQTDGRSILLYGLGTLRTELEPELIQAHMAQKPMLRVEVGARALCVRR